MATSEERQARALEGILAQLTFIVAEMRKNNENVFNTDDEGVPTIKVPVNFVRIATGLEAMTELDDKYMHLDEKHFAEVFLTDSAQVHTIRVPANAVRQTQGLMPLPSLGDLLEELSEEDFTRLFMRHPTRGHAYIIVTHSSNDNMDPSVMNFKGVGYSIEGTPVEVSGSFSEADD
jgi:hypothetical protein